MPSLRASIHKRGKSSHPIAPRGRTTTYSHGCVNSLKCKRNNSFCAESCCMIPQSSCGANIIFRIHSQDSLVVHVRLQHSGGASANTAGNAMVSGKPQQTGSTSLEEKLRRDRKWMPQAKVVIPSASTMNSGKMWENCKTD